MEEREEEDKFSLKAVKELVAWFAGRKDLPESLQMDPSAYIPDLADTIDGMSQMALENCEKPRFHTAIKRFYRLKEILENKPEARERIHRTI